MMVMMYVFTYEVSTSKFMRLCCVLVLWPSMIVASRAVSVCKVD